jgi:hypothetical protein
MTGQVYLIQVPEAAGTNRFKVGFSAKNNFQRLKSYKKGTRTLIVMDCANPSEVEEKLLDHFKSRFTLYCGREHFEGDENTMMQEFVYIVNAHKKVLQSSFADQKETSSNTAKPLQVTLVDGFEKVYRSPYDRYYPKRFLQNIAWINDQNPNYDNELLETQCSNCFQFQKQMMLKKGKDGKRRQFVPRAEFYETFFQDVNSILKRDFDIPKTQYEKIEEFAQFRRNQGGKWVFDLASIVSSKTDRLDEIEYQFQDKMRLAARQKKAKENEKLENLRKQKQERQDALAQTLQPPSEEVLKMMRMMGYDR